jgi:hypothetical protein
MVAELPVTFAPSVDRIRVVSGICGWWGTSYCEPAAPPIYIAQCDMGQQGRVGRPNQDTRLKAHWPIRPAGKETNLTLRSFFLFAMMASRTFRTCTYVCVRPVLVGVSWTLNRLSCKHF